MAAQSFNGICDVMKHDVGALLRSVGATTLNSGTTPMQEARSTPSSTHGMLIA
jgi:hypothetical protein